MITTLKQSPHYFNQTLQLIEEQFEYNQKNSFKVDFYPLIKKQNWDNCFLYINRNRVVAHLGALKRTFIIKNKTYTFSMYGGITVDPKYQGQGLFKKLFKYVLNQNSNSFMHLLWSEKIDLYNKFDFYPALSLNEYQKHSSTHEYEIKKVSLSDLSLKEYQQVMNLYINQQELRLHRDLAHWEELKRISSADFYLIVLNSKIINYFVLNKGQDLDGIIHEYGVIDEKFLNIMRNFGNVWSPFKSTFEHTNLYGALLKIGSKDVFKNFIKEYAKIDILKHTTEIEFQLESAIYSESTKDFIQGIFGPGRYQEINSSQILISGLDSI